MEQRTIVIRKWFWAWQDHKEEMWLQEMSQNGWHLKSVSLLTYEFKKGEPRNYVYRMDFRTESNKDMLNYLTFFEEAGWEYLGKQGSWQYFRMEVEEGKVAEIYTDPESKISKYQRLLGVLAAISPAFMVVFMGNIDRYPTWFAIILGTFYFTWMVIFIVSFLKISQRIKQLRSM